MNPCYPAKIQREERTEDKQRRHNKVNQSIAISQQYHSKFCHLYPLKDNKSDVHIPKNM